MDPVNSHTLSIFHGCGEIWVTPEIGLVTAG